MGDLVLFDRQSSFFSGAIPDGLRYLLSTAQSSNDVEKTEQLLLKAYQSWPQEPDSHIALYKFYFINVRYREAEIIAINALRQASSLGGFLANYRRLSSSSAEWAAIQGPSRWYLFTMKALGVIRLRRGKVVDAKRVLSKLAELDPGDEIGGGAYLQIAESF